MKRDSWDSEFRKKRFYENQRRRVLKRETESISSIKSILRRKPIIIPRSIAIMLDLEGTCDKIKDEEARIFLKQVDTIRKQFGNQKAYICISTHSGSSTQIKRVFDILSKYKSDDIILGTSFIRGGAYDYNSNSVESMGFFFNTNKLQTFVDHYLKTDLKIGGIFVIDDSLSKNAYIDFQRIIPMACLKPSQKDNSEYNNFMYRTTCTANFLGVIELMGKYLADIDGMTPQEILDEQCKMKRPLTSGELCELIENCQFGAIIEYLNSGMAKEFDFINTYATLIDYCKNGLGKQYDYYITELLKILEENKALDKPIEDVRKLIFKD